MFGVLEEYGDGPIICPLGGRSYGVPRVGIIGPVDGDVILIDLNDLILHLCFGEYAPLFGEYMIDI